MNLPTVFLLFLTTKFLTCATSSSIDHIYIVGDDLPLFVNKIGPLNNPSETYEYYELPFCRPDKVVQKKETLGEVLNGDRLANALYELKFRVDRVDAVLCQKTLGRNEIAKFREAIANDYYFQMYYDDLPLWGFIGKVEENNFALEGKLPSYYLFNHVEFDVLYNGNQIIEIHAFSDPNHSVDINEDVDVDVKFTYSVSWKETSTPFGNRMNRYTRASKMPVHQKIHWFSFINSTVIILLLMGFLSLLFMRHQKNDLRKYAGGDEEEDKDVGWKYIHSDVFRCPSNTSLFCAVLGSGAQLLTLVVFLFTLAFLGILYPYGRGALATSLVLIYTLTSAVAGYISASFCSNESSWDRSVLSGMLFLAPSLSMVFILNLVAIYFGTTAALPSGTIFVVFLVYILFGIPLLALGSLLGHRYRSDLQASFAAKKGPREVPPLAWYQKTPGQIFIGGLLPFSAIVLELHQLYASIWGYKIPTLPGILFITFIILIILTATLSIGLTFFQLTMEDHNWWWRSVLRGGAVAIFMFGYSIYFYFKSSMTGVLQTAIFFGYNACLCYAIFLMLGTISFYASLTLVLRIYRDVKNE